MPYLQEQGQSALHTFFRSSQRWIPNHDRVDRWGESVRFHLLEALMAMPGGSEALPHVRLFYGQPSRYLWEDESGNVHHIHQGEGGEQGDALMPLLLSLGQHSALEAVRARLTNGERLFAFLDDVYVTTPNQHLAGRVATTFQNPHQHWQESSVKRSWNSATSVR